MIHEKPSVLPVQDAEHGMPVSKIKAGGKGFVCFFRAGRLSVFNGPFCIQIMKNFTVRVIYTLVIEILVKCTPRVIRAPEVLREVGDVGNVLYFHVSVFIDFHAGDGCVVAAGDLSVFGNGLSQDLRESAGEGRHMRNCNDRLSGILLRHVQNRLVCPLGNGFEPVASGNIVVPGLFDPYAPELGICFGNLTYSGSFPAAYGVFTKQSARPDLQAFSSGKRLCSHHGPVLVAAVDCIDSDIVEAVGKRLCLQKALSGGEVVELRVVAAADIAFRLDMAYEIDCCFHGWLYGRLQALTDT